LPKDTPEQQAMRSTELEAATLRAAQVPLETAHRVVSVIGLALQAAELGNVNAISDAGTAAALARAALTGAGLNVRTNTLNLADRGAADRLLAEIESLETAAAEYEQRLRQCLRGRGRLPLS
jgi:glutamate formiminotransferase/formiminotetrahydrofolate cyclodeaminase